MVGAIQAICRPSQRQLRQFAACLPLAAWLLAWFWCRDLALASGAGGVAIVLAGLAWLWPGLIKPLYLGLLILGLPIGWLIRELVMLAVYFGLITPLACWFRLRQRDPLLLQQDKAQPSYWRSRNTSSEPSSYLRRW